MIWLIPVLAGTIGWLTNYLAIKMLFRPRTKIFGIQGLIPKRKSDLAKKIGRVVEEDLISIGDVASKYEGDIVHKIKSALRENFGGLYAIIPQEFISTIENHICKEVVRMLNDPELMESISIAEVVEDKINEFDVNELEDTIVNIAKNELRMIEILGAVIGVVVGVAQVFIMLHWGK
jgi:uncharacterized membrane protein YheB (UPF0754 family)